MRQTAQVVRRVAPGCVEVMVHRASACSSAHKCGSCDGCSLMANAPEIVVRAVDEQGCDAGDTVVVESADSSVIGAALTVYLLPFGLFFAGYLLGGALGWSEAVSIAVGGAGFVAAFVCAVILDRYRAKRRPVEYRVVEIAR